GHRAGRALAPRARAAARARARRAGIARASARRRPSRPPSPRGPAHRGRGGRAQPALLVIGRALGLGAAAWIGWAGVPHLFTPACAWRGPRGARRLALTFDDGPDPAWTPRVLDRLAARDVRATFFVVGERAERAPDVVRRMAAEGHEV